MKPVDPGAPGRRRHETATDDLVANPFDHRDEGVLREPFDPRRPAGVRVGHARRDRDEVKPGPREQRMEPTPDERVTPGVGLDLDEAGGRAPRVGVLRMEERRAVVSLDDGDRAAPPQAGLHARERAQRIREVLEDEADEDVVERIRRKGKLAEIRLLEGGVVDSGGAGPIPCLVERRWRDVDAGEPRARTVSGEEKRLGPHSTTRLEDGAAVRVPRVAVEQLGQRARLIAQAHAFALGVPMDVVVDHALTSSCFAEDAEGAGPGLERSCRMNRCALHAESASTRTWAGSSWSRPSTRALTSVATRMRPSPSA